MTLRTRLALLSAGLTLVGLTLGLVLLYFLLQNRALAEMDSELDLQAETVLQAALADPNNQLPPAVEDGLTQESGVSSTLIYRDKQLTFASGLLDIPEPLDPIGLVVGEGVASVAGWRVHTLSQGGLTVQLGRPLAPLERSLQRYIEVTVPLAVLLGLLAGGAAWAMVSLTLKDLEHLTAATRGFEAGAEVPPPRGKDEVATLARSFGDLLGRLRTQREREQRFLAFAAHELRTPIAAFRANLEAAQLKDNLDKAQLSRMHREALRLENLSQNLLALSRAESGEVRSQAIDLADLVAEAFDRFQPLALENGFELDLQANPAPVRADPQLIEQALGNLVINAIRYAQKGSITLSSGNDGLHSWLEVADRGPGLPPNLQEGLGLRVARSVASAFAGRFSLESAGGTVARLELPMQGG